MPSEHTEALAKKIAQDSQSTDTLDITVMLRPQGLYVPDWWAGLTTRPTTWEIGGTKEKAVGSLGRTIQARDDLDLPFTLHTCTIKEGWQATATGFGLDATTTAEHEVGAIGKLILLLAQQDPARVVVRQRGPSSLAPMKHSSTVPNGEKLLRVGEAAKILGVHAQTLRRYVDSETVKAYRFGPRKERRIPLEEVRRLKKDGLVQAQRSIILYTRIEVGQESAEANLVNLRQWAQTHYPETEPREIQDTGSRDDPDRPGLTELLSLIHEARPAVVAVTTAAQIAGRMGFTLIERLCQTQGIRLIVLDQQENE